MNLQDLLVDLKLNAEEFNQGLQSALGQWKKFSDDLLVTGAALSAGITAPLLMIGKTAVTMGQQLQSAEIGFSTMMGSAELAKGFLEELKDFAAKTPFEFKDLTEAAKRMMALGFAAEDVIPTMRSVGNAAAGLGGGAALIDRIILALGQMRAKGKVSAEEMRQLAEAGIPAWEILAKTIGVGIPEAMKMAEKGAVSAATAVPAIVAGMNEKFGGLMENFAKTAMGQWSNVKDAINFVLADIGNAILPLIATFMEKFAVPAATKLKELAQGFAALSTEAKTTIVVMAGLVAAIGPMSIAFGGLQKAYGPFVNVVSKTGVAMLGSISNITFALKEGLVPALSLGEKALLGLGVAGAAAAAIAAAGFVAWKIDPVRESIIDLGNTIQNFWTSTLQPFIEDIGSVGTAFIKAAADLVTSGLKAAIEGVTAALRSDLVRDFTASIKELGGAAYGVAKAFRPITEAMAPLVEGFGKLWVVTQAGYWTLLAGMAKAAFFVVGQEAKGLAIIIEQLAGLIKNVLKGAFEEMAGFIGAIAEPFAYSLNSWREMIKEVPLLGDALKKVADTFEGIKTKLGSLFGGKQATAPSVAEQTMKELKRLKQAVDDAKQVYGGWLEKLNNGEKVTIQVGESLKAITKAENEFKDALNAAGMSVEHVKSSLASVKTAYAAAVKELEEVKKARVAGTKSAQDEANAQAKLAQATRDQAAVTAWAGEVARLMGIDLVDLTGRTDAAGKKAMTAAEQHKALKARVQELKEQVEIFGSTFNELQRGYEMGIVTEAKYMEGVEKMNRLQTALQEAEDKLEPDKVAKRRAEAAEDQRKTSEKQIKEERNFLNQFQAISKDVDDAARKMALGAKDAFEEFEKAYEKLLKVLEEPIVGEKAKAAYDELLEKFIKLADGSKIVEAAMDRVHKAIQEGAKEQIEIKAPQEEVYTTTNEAGETEYVRYRARTEQQIMVERVMAIAEARKKLRDALKGLGVETTEDLRNTAKAYDQFLVEVGQAFERGSVSYSDYLKAVKESLQAQIAAHKSAGDQIWKEEEKVLKSIDKELEKYGGKAVTFWETFGNQVSLIINDFAKDIAKGLVSLFGGGRAEHNKGLQDQIKDLESSLVERTQDWEEYQAEIAQKWEDAQGKYAAELAKEEEDLAKSLAEREQEYADAEAETLAKIGEGREERARQLAEEVADVEDSLAERVIEYEDYAREVSRKLDDTREEHADSLRRQLEDLQDNLDERAEAYEEYVNDARKTLDRLYEDYVENLDDETKDTKRKIDEKQKDYDRDEQDTLERIARLKREGKGEGDDEIKDLRKTLARKKEDLAEYIAEVTADLEEYVSDQQRRLTREETDLADSLARRTKEWEDFQKDTATKWQTAIEDNAKSLAKEEEDLLLSLNNRLKELDKYKADAALKIEGLKTKYAEEQAKEEAELIASLDKKKTALDKYREDVATKLDTLRTDYAAKLELERQELQKSLADRKKDYDTFVDETSQKIEDIRTKFRSVTDDIGNFFKSAFASAAEAVTRFVTETLVGNLLKVLKEDIWGALSAVGSGIAGIFTGGASAAASYAAPAALTTAGIAVPSSMAIAAPTLSSVGAPAASAGAGLAGTAGSTAASTAMSAVGAIGSAVGAISGVIGNFQMAGMNKTLDEMGRTLIKLEHYNLVAVTTQLAYLPKLEDIWWYHWNAEWLAYKMFEDYLEWFKQAYYDLRDVLQNTLGSAVLSVKSSIDYYASRMLTQLEKVNKGSDPGKTAEEMLKENAEKLSEVAVSLEDNSNKTAASKVVDTLDALMAKFLLEGPKDETFNEISDAINLLANSGVIPDEAIGQLNDAVEAMRAEVNLPAGQPQEGPRMLAAAIRELRTKGFDTRHLDAAKVVLDTTKAALEAERKKIKEEEEKRKADIVNMTNLRPLFSEITSRLDELIRIFSNLFGGTEKPDIPARSELEQMLKWQEQALAYAKAHPENPNASNPAYLKWLLDAIKRTKEMIEQWDMYEGKGIPRPTAPTGPRFAEPKSAARIVDDISSALQDLDLTVPIPVEQPVSSVPVNPITRAIPVTEGGVAVKVEEIRVAVDVDGRQIGDAVIRDLWLRGVRV